MSKENISLWSEEDELEFQVGDMNGVAFVDTDGLPKKILTPEKKIDSNDKPDFVTPPVPFYENIVRK